ncbi:MAG: hypothetical protein ACI3XA_04705 [Clostridia bacterium]
MKKKLIIIFALCFAFSTVVNATANVATEETTVAEDIVEPEFSLFVATVTEVEGETETEIEETENQTDEVESETIEATVTESDIVEEATEAVVEETETEPMTEAVVEETPSEYETESEGELESMPMGEVTEAETMEFATEISSEVIEEKPEYIEPTVNAIVIGDETTTEGKRIFIQIMGENLLDKCANIKVRPINTYKDFYYIRTIILDNDFSNDVRIALPEDATGLYRVDISVENTARETKVVAIGESSDSELKCEAYRKTALITGQSKTEGVKAVSIKILNDDGNIVFLRQINTAEDGSYSLNVTLPAESMNYVVWAVVEGESNGYVKTMTLFGPDSEKANITYTLTGEENEIADVLVYGKNILDKSKYVYEIDYSENATAFEIFDLCAFTRDKETDKGYTENIKIEILSVSGGKIRFVVENDSEFDNEKLWSGIINVVRLKKTTNQGVNITLRVYE